MSTDHEERMKQAREEMEAQQPTDPTATTYQFATEIGYSSHAVHHGVTTSPKIANHDVPYNKLRNKFNDLESSDVEALLEYCYGGQSVVDASTTNFESFDPKKLAEILAMSEEEVEDLLYDEEEENEDE